MQASSNRGSHLKEKNLKYTDSQRESLRSVLLSMHARKLTTEQMAEEAHKLGWKTPNGDRMNAVHVRNYLYAARKQLSHRRPAGELPVYEERVMDFLRLHQGSVRTGEVLKLVKGAYARVNEAVEALVAKGLITQTGGFTHVAGSGKPEPAPRAVRSAPTLVSSPSAQVAHGTIGASSEIPVLSDNQRAVIQQILDNPRLKLDTKIFLIIDMVRA